MEMDLEERIVQLLTPLVGAAGVLAKVNVEIDTTRVVETNETFDPEKTAVRSEQRSEQTSNDASAAAGGVPGIGSNLPNRAGAAGNNSKATSNVEEVTNYEVSKSVRQTTQDGSTVSRVTVAVLLDQAALKGPDGKPMDVAKIESLIKGAVGFSAERKDTVEINVEPFMAVDEEAAPPAPWMEPDVIVPAARYATFALLAMMLFFFVIRPLSKSLKDVRPMPQDGPVARELEVEVVGRRVGDIDADAERIVDRVEGRSYPQLRTDIVELSKGDLDKTALILRQWIRSDAQA
jgi:flagellar M-ring protein FliF